MNVNGAGALPPDFCQKTLWTGQVHLGFCVVHLPQCVAVGQVHLGFYVVHLPQYVSLQEGQVCHTLYTGVVGIEAFNSTT